MTRKRMKKQRELNHMKRFVYPGLTAAMTMGLMVPTTFAQTHRHAPQPPRSVHSGKSNKNILAPANRTMTPVAVYKVLPRDGTVTNADGLIHPNGKPTTLSLKSGNQTNSPLLILDMGKEVGGHVSVDVTSYSANHPQLHVSYSESTQYMALAPGQNDGETSYAPGSDTANIWNGYPGFPYTYDADSHVIPVNSAKVPGVFSDTELRGGYRYITLYLSSPGTISIKSIHVHFSGAPLQKDPADYQGYFSSSNPQLNKIWYAGAYTVQLDTQMPNTLKSWPYSNGEPDQANSTITTANPNQEVILDGAKRDRDVWQGDLSIEGPVTYLTTGDDAAVTNSLTALAKQQVASGYVPAEGLLGPHNFGEEYVYGGYVTWFINNMYQHYLYTGDKKYLDTWYPNMVKAMNWLAAQKDSTGLIDFQNSGATGTYGYSASGHLTYMNALYYQNLIQMAKLAKAEHDISAAQSYQASAVALKKAMNTQLWNPQTGAYQMSLEQTGTFPQDGNAAAIITGVADSQQAKQALAYLKAHTWSTYGSLMSAPGSAGIPSYYAPLPSEMEVEARFMSGDATSATDLINKFWGYMLNAPFGPQSTFWEAVNQQGLPNIAQFTSLAHGWASGPTISLTQDLLGVQPQGPGYSEWSAIPHPGNVKWAQGGVPTPHGLLKFKWSNNRGSFQEWLTAPKGTSGRVGIPLNGKATVRLNGHLVWNGSQAVSSSEASGVTVANGYLMLSGVTGGHYHVQEQPSK